MGIRYIVQSQADTMLQVNQQQLQSVMKNMIALQRYGACTKIRLWYNVMNNKVY